MLNQHIRNQGYQGIKIIHLLPLKNVHLKQKLRQNWTPRLSTEWSHPLIARQLAGNLQTVHILSGKKWMNKMVGAQYTNISFWSFAVSGLKNCGKKQELFKYDTCTLKDKKPVLKYVTSWRSLPSAQQCKERCDGETKCQIWEWQKFRKSDQVGDCHAYTMDFRTSANSMSGPVECRV